GRRSGGPHGRGQGLVECQLLSHLARAFRFGLGEAAPPRDGGRLLGQFHRRRGNRRSAPAPLSPHENAQGEGERENREGGHDQARPLKKSAASLVSHGSGVPSLVMLSGADTPSSSRPFRITCPTAAARPRRARVSGRASVMI